MKKIRRRLLTEDVFRLTDTCVVLWLEAGLGSRDIHVGGWTWILCQIGTDRKQDFGRHNDYPFLVGKYLR